MPDTPNTLRSSGGKVLKVEAIYIGTRVKALTLSAEKSAALKMENLHGLYFKCSITDVCGD